MNNKIEFLADELNREITRSIIGGAEKATPAQKEDLRKSSREVSRCGGYYAAALDKLCAKLGEIVIDTVKAYIQAEKLSSEIRRIGNDLLREAVLTDPRPSQRYINSLLKDLTHYTEKSFQVVVFICRVYLDAIEKAEEDTKNDN